MQQKQSLHIAIGGLIILLVLYGLTTFGLMGPNPIGSTSRATAPLLVPRILGIRYLGADLHRADCVSHLSSILNNAPATRRGSK